MQKGSIKRQRDSLVIGHWRADSDSIEVETDDLELRKAAGEILKKPQTIPIHGAEHYEFAAGAVPLVETPSNIKFLALFALEMEERGFELEPEDD
jgi:hypothetical protein